MTTIGLDPTTVEQAGAIMARTLGLKWPQDRREIVERINDYRDLLYNLYDDLKLFDNVFHCISVSNFPNDCGSPCWAGTSCYQGFVLPDDVVSIEAAWEYGYPLKIRSRWREAQMGIGIETLARIEITEMARQTCTERALTHLSGLKMYAEAEEDAGKKVYIEAIMENGSAKTLCFTLRSDGWAVITSAVRQIVSVSLPAGCHGSITLAQIDGYELSIYGPHETVPAYRQFRVARACRAGTILIQGVKRFIPVHQNYDIVEVGSRSVLLAAGSHLKFKENTTDRADLNRAAFDKTEMGQHLLGVHARHKGHAVQDGSPFRGRTTGPSTVMPGYQKR